MGLASRHIAAIMAVSLFLCALFAEDAEVAPLEFDENGRGVRALDNWSASPSEGEAGDGKVAAQPQMSYEEERLLDTRYDKDFKEPNVPIILPPEATDNGGNNGDGENDKDDIEVIVHDVPVAGNTISVAQAESAPVSGKNAAIKDTPASNNAQATPTAAARTTAPAARTPATDRMPNRKAARTEYKGGSRITDNKNIMNAPRAQSAAGSKQAVSAKDADSAKDAGSATSTAEGGNKSRTVTIKREQYLDVVYPGAGWVYLGEGTTDNKKLSFKGRKLGETETAFTLRSQHSGTAVLHFYKRDVLANNYIDDYLEVIVTDEAAASEEAHATAPSYAAVVPPRPAKKVRASNNDGTEGQTTVQRDAVQKNNAKTNDVKEDDTQRQGIASTQTAKSSQAEQQRSDKAGTARGAQQAAKGEQTRNDRGQASKQAEMAGVVNRTETQAAGTDGGREPSGVGVSQGRTIVQSKQESSPSVEPPLASQTRQAEQPTSGQAQGFARTAPSASPFAASATSGNTQPSVFDSSAQTGESLPQAGLGEVASAARVQPSVPAAEDALASVGSDNASEIFTAAQKAYDEKRYADCLSYLNAFFDKSTARVDEGLYLEGMALEARSNVQNIKGAIDTYNILMKNYPASKLWNKARERSIYLKRMYIDIR